MEFDDYQQQGAVYDSFLEQERQQALSEGKKPFIIPEGGSGPLGCFGYVAAAEELAADWASLAGSVNGPDHLFVALGSGGTLAGLHLGYQLLGWSADQISAVNVCDDADYFQRRVGCLLEETCDEYGLSGPSAALDIRDGYVGGGYAVTNKEELTHYLDLLRLEGIMLDPVYTGKAFIGMIKELEANPRDFGDDICFLHTGGGFANFAFAETYAPLINS